jgi:hypothetical protein
MTDQSSVAVVVPWRDGCPHRGAALAWVGAMFTLHHPDWQIVLGRSPEGPFNRSAAIIDGAQRSDGDVIVVADGDVWTDYGPAVTHCAEFGWARPHRLVHRLSAESTERVLAGADWQGLPLSVDNGQDHKPYRGFDTGTAIVVARDVLFDISPDVRFVGWGHEDQAWGRALRVLHGEPWRGDADLVHLWHPPQPRRSRSVGSVESKRLWQRYKAADRNGLRRLVEESKREHPAVLHP